MSNSNALELTDRAGNPADLNYIFEGNDVHIMIAHASKGDLALGSSSFKGEFVRLDAETIDLIRAWPSDMPAEAIRQVVSRATEFKLIHKLEDPIEAEYLARFAPLAFNKETGKKEPAFTAETLLNLPYNQAIMFDHGEATIIEMDVINAPLVVTKDGKSIS
tara:strand:+ start:2091 stop:2576 length:486 start_codon:yes stop_codon:yes gene_type:complete